MITSLGRKLGNGSFGEVFLATDAVHGVVAVKVLRQRGMADAEFAEVQSKLLSEGQSMAKASHPNVVQVYGVEQQSDGTMRLVMEYCEGGSIAAAHEKGPLPLHRVRTIANDVALGLGAIHAREMLHRDIKPANILIGAKGVVKISDFGLVTDRISHSYASQKGYLPHLAKEFWEGRGTSKKTDVWALGMTLYRLAHGLEWYESRVPQADHISKGGYARLLPWLPHVTDKWRRFVRKCMHDSTALRYQTAGEVLDELAKLPIAPEWECSLSDEHIHWSASEGDRMVHVELEVPERGPLAWSAYTLPIKGGRRYTLASGALWEELEVFFEKRQC